MANKARPEKIDLETLYASGMDQAAIAKHYGVHRITVVHWFKRHGISARDRGLRLHMSTANHVSLCKEAREFLDGDLLGDAGLEQGKYSARIGRGCKYREVLEWYNKQLSDYGIEASGEIYQNDHVRKGNPVTVYLYHSRYYADLKSVAERFYPNNGIKRIPTDIALTPLSLLMEYIGDGVMWTPGASSQIQLCTDAFPKEDVEWLVAQLRRLGFFARYYECRNRVRINTSSVIDFLEFIGPCPDELRPFYAHTWKPFMKGKEINVLAEDSWQGTLFNNI